MTVFEVDYVVEGGTTYSTLFVSREIAEASIRLSYHKIPEPERSERIAREIKSISEVHVHDRVTHL